MIEDIANAAEGALKPVKIDALKKPQSKGFLGYISFGYYGQPQDNEVFLDNRLSYILLKSCCLRSINRVDEAFELLEEAITYREFIHDKLVLVILLIECGRCNLKAGNTEQACEFFKEALKPTSYGWEEVIRNRIRSYLSQLNVQTDFNDTEEIEGELDEFSKEEQNEGRL